MPHMLTPPADFSPTPPNRKRWTRADCEFLERVGVLRERYELIDGEIISKMGQNQPHAITIVRLVKWLISVFGGDFVLCQLPVEVTPGDQPNNKPEPDASVLARPATDFPSDAPGPGDVLFVVEVSDSTLRDDLTVKAAVYARAGFPEYWVLDVTSRRLIVHRQPTGGAYGEVAAFLEDETLAPLAAPSQTIRVADLLPPVFPAP